MGKAPGRHYRKGITLTELFDLFPDEAAAERWFVAQRWPNGMRCAHCDSADVCERKNRKPQPYRCRTCRKDFGVKVGTVMHGSKLSLRTWAIAIYARRTPSVVASERS
ncbi:transposase [Candidatus Poriferisodalis sp.]|uniref:transposase n=1 Tax=Candidatus Poriferisodalis sp. TaxID=3101277 RepID=UPI003D137AAD